MMYQKYIRVIILGGILASANLNAMACKMSAMGGSAQTMTAVINYVAEDPQQQNRTIEKIQQTSATSWVYLVETIQEDTDCQATAYQATIEPSCQITVQPLVKKFSCRIKE